MAVSKSASEICPERKIGRRRNLSRYEMVIIKNKTVPEPIERRGLSSRYQKVLLSLEIYQGTERGQFPNAAFLLTARQYGEVVLPHAASGHGPDSLATKLSRCKEGMAWFLQIQVQVLSKPGVSRYKFDRSR